MPKMPSSAITSIGALLSKAAFRLQTQEMWTILSGNKSSYSSEMPDENNLEPEYLTVSDVGLNLKPELSPVKVNNLLSKTGYQKRIDGSWKATEKGKGMSIELDGGYSKYGNKTYLRWEYGIISVLNTEINKEE